ncbi:MAG: NADH-quinone oxidoreductase subunit M [Candidatus Krumholzibacteriia bacterium]
MIPASTLSWVVFLPLGGALAVAILPAARREAIKTVALCTAALPAARLLMLLLRLDPRDLSFQFVEHYTWAPALGFEYYLGVDGLSLPLMVMTAVVTFMALLTAWSVEHGAKGFYALVLVLEAGVLGALCALDTALLWLFWELALVALFFLVTFWGDQEGHRAGRQFLVLSQAGALAMLLALLALRQHTLHPLTGGPTGSLPLQLNQANHDAWLGAPGVRRWLFGGILLGCGVLVPLVPLHVWQPRLHRATPLAVPLLATTVVSKLGFYGLLRLGLPILPDAAVWARPALLVLGAVASVYGGLGALGRRDLAVILGYGSLSLMGLALVGVFTLTREGLVGAGQLLVAHGLVYAMLFAAADGLRERKGHLDVERWGGLFRSAPTLAVLLCLALLAAWGMPGLAIYPGAAMVLSGAMVLQPWAAVAGACGLLLAAAWASRVILRICLGEPAADLGEVQVLRGRELGVLVPLAVLVLGLGMYPRLVADLMATVMADLVRIVGG